jgi:hypothetical protein
LFLTYFY